MFIKLILPLVFCGLITACAHSVPNAPDAQAGSNPLSALINFYRGPLNHLAAVRGNECPMYPSDSAYGLESIEKHGMFMGWIMAMDRFMRCGRDETRLSPRIFVNGQWKSLDPVENNDFWWQEQTEHIYENHYTGHYPPQSSRKVQ